MKITIDVLTADDFAEVYTLWKREGLFVDSYESEQNEYFLIVSLNRNTCICLKDSVGRILGTSLGTFNGAWGWVCRVAVESAYQGNGLGRQLLDETEKRLKQAGASKIMLSVNCSNTKVIPFYEKLGFKEKDSLFLYKKLAP